MNKRKKLERFQKKLIIRTDEAVTNLRSKNLPCVCELPIMIGILAQSAAMFKAAVQSKK